MIDKISFLRNIKNKNTRCAQKINLDIFSAHFQEKYPSNNDNILEIDSCNMVVHTKDKLILYTTNKVPVVFHINPVYKIKKMPCGYIVCILQEKNRLIIVNPYNCVCLFKMEITSNIKNFYVLSDMLVMIVADVLNCVKINYDYNS